MPEDTHHARSEEPTEERVAFEVQRAEIIRRCDSAGIKYNEPDFGGTKTINILLPNGRKTRRLFVPDSRGAKQLLKLDFEDYVVLGDYLAIASYKEGRIEAALRPLTPGPSFYMTRRLFGPEEDSGDSPRELVVSMHPDTGAASIRIGPASRMLTVLSGRRHRPSRMPTLTIENVDISRHDHALDLLERVSASFLFQVDLERGVQMHLARHREPPLRSRRSHTDPEPRALEFPTTEFDKAPMALYQYATSAVGMPLLQFLAFYQVIEYYFPAYSQAEARRRIRNVLKDPTFRPDRDTDIAKILTSAQTTGAVFGDERSQLRATLQECVDPSRLREYLEQDERRREFFSSKKAGLTDHRVPIANASADLRNDVAERIYDIRCKIVHTKVGGRSGEVELLLPFSREAEALHEDIALIQHVARSVLVSASTTLRL